MTFSKDLRWRALVLFEFQGMDIKDVSYLLGVSVPSIRNWVSQFKRTGTVEPARTRRQQTRWPTEVVEWVIKLFLSDTSTFYKLQSYYNQAVI